MVGLVSVILPTYNRSALLRRALGSVLAQSYPRLEVIVVDDGSTDDTGEMLRSCFGAMPAIRVLRQENHGVCVARNRALDAAQGDFIAFLDSDDTWQPWKTEVQVACLARRPEAGMVWTDMVAIGPGGEQRSGAYLREMYANYRWFPDDVLFEGVESLRDIMPDCPASLADVPVRWGRIQRAMALGNLVHTSTVMLTRQRLEQVGRFDETLAPAGEDHDFHLRTCEAGPVGLIDTPAIHYQTGAADRLTRHAAIMARNFLLTMERAVARAPAGAAPPRRRLRQARAMGHGWLAEALLEEGKRSEARRHLLLALRFDPRQPRLAAELLATVLPRRLERALHAGRHGPHRRPACAPGQAGGS